MSGGRVLVYGLGVSGTAVARHLLAEGTEVVAVDDDGGERTRRAAAELGIAFVVGPDPRELRRLAEDVDEVVVSPGIPARHPVFALGGGIRVVGEVELAWRRARAPVAAVTGTNGKTTVTTLVHAMLEESGRTAIAAGNIGAPLVDALASDAEVVVAEVSSFQLALTDTFRPAVGAWLNFSPDHIDWHGSLDAYREAKARLWANAGSGDVAVANAEDPVVMAATDDPRRRGASVVTFGLRGGDYTVRAGALVGPSGEIARIAELRRSLPHDVSNALCASAVALSVGADLDGCRRALASFAGLPHRVALVGEAKGVRYYDDSKATTPGAVLAALEGFDHAVLIAGGRNKGLDLTVLAQAAPRLRGVVAIGEAASQVVHALNDATTVTTARSMEGAVRAARAMARSGDAVILSPACASFDWYGSYAERGDDFARWVRAVVADDDGHDEGRRSDDPDHRDPRDQR